jgi:hypothetical protein
MTATNKRYSYLRVAAIRIDVHPAEKIRSTHHTLFMLDPCRVLDHTSHVVHVGKLSLVPMRTKQTPTPERSLSDQRHTGSIITLGHLILPPSRQPCSTGEWFRLNDYTATSACWIHIPACGVQYLLVGTNPSVLNRHRRGLQS